MAVDAVECGGGGVAIGAVEYGSGGVAVGCARSLHRPNSGATADDIRDALLAWNTGLPDNGSCVCTWLASGTAGPPNGNGVRAGPPNGSGVGAGLPNGLGSGVGAM